MAQTHQNKKWKTYAFLQKANQTKGKSIRIDNDIRQKASRSIFQANFNQGLLLKTQTSSYHKKMVTGCQVDKLGSQQVSSEGSIL